jgi:hypothetical protein
LIGIWRDDAAALDKRCAKTLKWFDDIDRECVALMADVGANAPRVSSQEADNERRRHAFLMNRDTICRGLQKLNAERQKDKAPVNAEGASVSP